MSGWEVPLVDIEVTDEDVEAVLDCLRSGWLTMGPRTQRFEQAISAAVGAEEAVAVSSGTAALHLAMRAIGIGPGDEVVVPAFTFVATAHVVRHCGAEVVFADSESPLRPNSGPQQIAAAIGPRTKAVIAVHFWGYPAEVEAIRGLCDERGIALVEDCAQAIGARTRAGAGVGTVGDLGCFSFFSKKQLSVGEGGALAGPAGEQLATARSLRSHAMSSVTWERHRGHGLGYDVTDIGFNYRMDEPHAALGLSRIARLGDEIEARRRVARAYRERLDGLDGIELPFDDEDVELSSHFAMPVLVDGDAARRDAIRATLQAQGIQTTWYPALPTLSAYADPGRPATPGAGELGDRHFVLPMHASLGEGQLDLIVEHLAEALAS
jgi:dTDP-4-amino-4,6-dideoxygalactose transaminase